MEKKVFFHSLLIKRREVIWLPEKQTEPLFHSVWLQSCRIRPNSHIWYRNTVNVTNQYFTSESLIETWRAWLWNNRCFLFVTQYIYIYIYIYHHRNKYNMCFYIIYSSLMSFSLNKRCESGKRFWFVVNILIQTQNVISATLGFLLKNKTKADQLQQKVWSRSGPPGGINTRSHIRFCSDPELLTDGRRAEWRLYNTWD